MPMHTHITKRTKTHPYNHLNTPYSGIHAPHAHVYYTGMHNHLTTKYAHSPHHAPIASPTPMSPMSPMFSLHKLFADISTHRNNDIPTSVGAPLLNPHQDRQTHTHTHTHTQIWHLCTQLINWIWFPVPWLIYIVAELLCIKFVKFITAHSEQCE